MDNSSRFIYNVIENQKTKQQYFYDIKLVENLVRVYNSQGNLKIIRKLPIPPYSKIIPVASYLICLHQHLITLIHILDPKHQVMTCPSNKISIVHALYESSTNLIFIIDSNNVISYLQPSQTLKHKIIMNIQFDQKPQRFFVGQNGILYLYFGQERYLAELQVDFERNIVISNKIIKQNLIDFYIKGQWNAFITKQSPEENTLLLEVNDFYRFNLPKDGDYVMTHSANTFLCIDKKNYHISMIHNDLQIHNVRQNQTYFTFLKANQMMFTAYQTQEFCVKLIIKSYSPVHQKFQTKVIDIETVREKKNQIILQKNIKNIFKCNGFINPGYFLLVKDILKQYQQNIQRQIQQRGQINQYRKVNFSNSQEVAYRFFLYIFDEKPRFLPLIARKFIQYELNISYSQIQRFMFFAEKIIDDRIISILKENPKNTLSRLPNSQCAPYLIQFIGVFVQQLQLYNIDQPSQNLKKYKLLLTKLKSLDIIMQILRIPNLQDNILRLFKQFSKINLQNQQKYKQNSIWWKNQYFPKLCHQYFQDLPFTPIRDSPQLVQYLLLNISNPYQIAYFYYFLSQRPNIPQTPPTFNVFYIECKKLIDYPQYRNEQQIKQVKYKICSMASIAIQMQQYSFMKYVCQLSIHYSHPNIAVMILQTGFFEKKMIQLGKHENDYQFVIKTYVMGGYIDIAYLWVCKFIEDLNKINYNKQQYIDAIYSTLTKICYQNGAAQQLYNLELSEKEKKFIFKQIEKIDYAKQFYKILQEVERI